MGNDYPPDWNQRRQRVYERDDYKCQSCGKRGGPYGSTELHAHHMVPLKEGGTNDMNNLITVCSSCHNKLHSSHSSPTAVSRDSKGPLHKNAERGINSEINGCPKCGDWDLSVQWYRKGPFQKSKLITCESCRTLFREVILETPIESQYALREVDSVEDVPTHPAAVLYEINKHRKLGNLPLFDKIEEKLID